MPCTIIDLGFEKKSLVLHCFGQIATFDLHTSSDCAVPPGPCICVMCVLRSWASLSGADPSTVGFGPSTMDGGVSSANRQGLLPGSIQGACVNKFSIYIYIYSILLDISF